MQDTSLGGTSLSFREKMESHLSRLCVRRGRELLVAREILERCVYRVVVKAYCLSFMKLVVITLIN